MPFKSGFVSIIGRPNVGKSTLLNQLIGQKLSIISPKASTTRHRILGIVNDDDYQMVFSDTPGVIKSANELHNAMMGFVWEAMDDSDLLVFMTDVEDELLPEFVERINQVSVPVVVILNKIDLSTQTQVSQRMEELKSKILCAEVIPLSALYHFDVKDLLSKLLHYIPVGEPYFPQDQLTDRTERFFVAEIIREHIFNLYAQEIPYSCEVNVWDFKERGDRIDIYAEIHVERQSQKGILIGKGGEGIKRLGTKARKQIEDFLESHVFLDLRVKVTENWRKKDLFLQRFGYKNN